MRLSPGSQGPKEIAHSNDYGGVKIDQFFCKFLHPVDLAAARPNIDPDIKAVVPAELHKPLLQCVDPGSAFEIAFCEHTQHGDPRHPLAWLLRARRERPRSDRAADAVIVNVAPPHEPPRSPRTTPYHIERCGLLCVTAKWRRFDFRRWVRSGHGDDQIAMSALPPKADIRPGDQECLLWAKLRHMQCSELAAYSITCSAKIKSCRWNC